MLWLPMWTKKWLKFGVVPVLHELHEGRIHAWWLRVRSSTDAPVLTEPVMMEVLSGPTDPGVVAQLERLVDGLPLLPVDANLDYRAARKRGRTVRSLVDCLIAVVAARTGTVLVHRDRDFGLIAECLPDLRLHPR